MYAQVDVTIRHHRKVVRLARALGVGQAQAIGHLTCLWTFAVESRTDGDLTGLSEDDLAIEAMWEGDAAKFFGALLFTGFIEYEDLPEDEMTDEQQQRLMLHDWDNYGGKILKQREQANERQRRHQEKLTGHATKTDRPRSTKVEMQQQQRHTAQAAAVQAPLTTGKASLAVLAGGAGGKSRVSNASVTVNNAYRIEERREEKRETTPSGVVERESSADAPPAPASRSSRSSKGARSSPKDGETPNALMVAAIAGLGVEPGSPAERRSWGRSLAELERSGVTPDELQHLSSHMVATWKGRYRKTPGTVSAHLNELRESHQEHSRNGSKPQAGVPNGQRPAEPRRDTTSRGGSNGGYRPRVTDEGREQLRRLTTGSRGAAASERTDAGATVKAQVS